ncbi:MAG TPA: nitrate ABC transporter, permease protein, partial [Beijerinckiaceae bacterium]|nr:nitrate ABC transporter, permease protein [Beijerinckiaceae bacterium]
MPALKLENATALRRAGKVLTFRSKPVALRARLLPVFGDIAARVVPPLVVLALMLLVWELLC